MVANFRSTTIWSSPAEMPELLSCGFVNAVMRSFAAYRLHHGMTRGAFDSGLEKTPLYHKFVCPVFCGCRFDNIDSAPVWPPRTIHVAHVEPMYHIGWISHGQYTWYLAGLEVWH